MEVGRYQLELSDSGKGPNDNGGVRNGAEKYHGMWLGAWGPEAEVLLRFAVKIDSIGSLFMRDMVCNPQCVNTSLQRRFKK